MDVAYDLGTGEVEDVRVAGHVVGVIPEALAPVGLLPFDVLLDQDPVRAVEHDDSLVEEISQLFDGRLHEKRSRPREIGSGGSAGSLGVW